MIRHESQPESVEAARTTREAFEKHYEAKGWKVVGDDPAATDDPSLSVVEQTALLHSDPDKLKEALAPSGSDAESADKDAGAKASARRGGNKA
jgi:hypothetical protein